MSRLISTASSTSTKQQMGLLLQYRQLLIFYKINPFGIIRMNKKGREKQEGRCLLFVSIPTSYLSLYRNSGSNSSIDVHSSDVLGLNHGH